MPGSFTISIEVGLDIEMNVLFDLYSVSELLSKEIQTKVLDLHDASPGDDLETKIVRIMNTNSCRHVNQKLNTESQNLYLTNSMINHSCNPNCCWKPSGRLEKRGCQPFSSKKSFPHYGHLLLRLSSLLTGFKIM